MAKKRLSKRREVFISEYINNRFNATQAAIKAGYSEKSARVAGHRLITNDNVAEEIALRVKEMCMSGEEAMGLLSDQAKGTLDDCMDVTPGGRSVSLNFEKLKERGKLHLIKSITPTANGLKVELYSSQRALELIAKAQGVFVDKVDITTKGEKIANDPEKYDRAMSTLADAIGSILSRQGAKGKDDLDSSESTSVVGPTIES